MSSATLYAAAVRVMQQIAKAQQSPESSDFEREITSWRAENPDIEGSPALPDLSRVLDSSRPLED